MIVVCSADCAEGSLGRSPAFECCLICGTRHYEGHEAHLLESPKDGLMPTLQVHPLGPLMEFPVSVPSPANAKLDATPEEGDRESIDFCSWEPKV